MRPAAFTQKPTLIVLIAPIALIGVAWLLLIAMEQSPYGQVMMGHAAVQSAPTGLGSTQHSGFGIPVSFTVGWIIMVIAMMMPGELPTVMRFCRSLSETGGRAWPLFLMLGGYVLAWTGFGVCAHSALEAAGLTASGSPLIGPAALVVAGIYQLSPLKRRFIHGACSLPVMLPRGSESRLPWVPILLLGGRDGVACMGCCWALMLLMLVGMTGSIGGMLTLGALMWVEKNAPLGHRLITPLGLFLVGLGLTLVWGSLAGTLPWHEHLM